MEVRLKQFDITINQCFKPYINDEIDDNYIRYYVNRINKRIYQINTLSKLLSDYINDEEFFKLASTIYDIKYENASYLKTDIASNGLMIKLKVSSKKKLPTDYNFSYDELLSYFKIGNVLLDNVYITDSDDNYDDYDDEELCKYFGKFRNFSEIISHNNTIELRKILTQDRIRKDLKELVDFTKMEINYIINRLNSDKLTKVKELC